MKILLVNKFNFIKGGADRYFIELADALRSQGFEVAKFCMSHPRNRPDPFEKYFVSNVDYFSKLSLFGKLRAAFRLLYNIEAKKKFEQLLKDFKPDIIHIGNIYHQISPSILPVAKKYGIPVVMHLNDYKLISPNYNLYDHGRINERSLGGRYYTCLVDRCYNNSWAQSLLVTFEMYLHHTIFKMYEKNIDRYIAPSEFMRSKVIAAGIAAEKIVTLPYFVAGIEAWQPNYTPGDYLLFFGRLTQSKGVDVLLQALARVSLVSLKIVGEGEEEQNLRKLVSELEIQERVEFCGSLFGENLKEAIGAAYAVVVPSVWYEVFGLVNVEAAALGKPVIASRIGGIPEAVNEGATALLCEPGSVEDIAKKIKIILEDRKLAEQMGKAGRLFVSDRFTANAHLAKLLPLYEELLER